MSIRSALFTSSLVAVAGTFSFLCSEAQAGPITTYAIDAQRSYVRAYVRDEWSSGGNAWGGGAGGASAGVEGDVDDVGDATASGGWNLVDFSFSGSFSLETVLSESEPSRSRLYLRDQAIVTEVPGYPGFGLPYFFAKENDELAYSDDTCFDFGFYSNPAGVWPCGGAVGGTGGTRSDTGMLKNGVLSVDGVVTGWGGSAHGLQYHMVAMEAAVAVPEPATVLLIAGGLGAMGAIARRRKTRAS